MALNFHLTRKLLTFTSAAAEIIMTKQLTNVFIMAENLMTLSPI